MPIVLAEQRRALLAYHARFLSNLGIHEEGGQNKGEAVEFFQRAVDNLARGEPWCAAFVWACIFHIDKMCALIFNDPTSTGLVPSEWTVGMWQASQHARVPIPEPGDLVIWNHYENGQPSNAGHTGIVIEPPNDGWFKTVEGNTGAGKGVVREGDGVFARTRHVGGEGDMRVMGYLRVWLP